MTEQHPLFTWLVAHHGKADTPLGDLAHELKRALRVPSSGDLRPWLRDQAVPQWMLDTYDEALAQWTSAHACLSPGCTSKAAGGASHFCAPHGGRSHQAGGNTP